MTYTDKKPPAARLNKGSDQGAKKAGHSADTLRDRKDQGGGRRGHDSIDQT